MNLELRYFFLAAHKTQCFSILSKSVLDFYFADKSKKDRAVQWAENSELAEVFSLGNSDYQRLSRSGLLPSDKVEAILCASLEYLLSVFDRNTFIHVRNRLDHILSKIFRLERRPLEDLANNNSHIYHILNIFIMRFATFPKHMLPGGINNFLDRYPFIRLNDILEATELQVLKLTNVSYDSLYLLYGLKELPDVYRCAFSPHFALFNTIKSSANSFDVFLESWAIQALEDNRKWWEILYLRMFSDGKKMTLENLGKKYGLSRERIRQIIISSCKKLGKPANLKKIQPLWDIIERVTGAYGIISLENLTFITDRIFEWNDTLKPHALAGLISINPGLALGRCSCRSDRECIIYSINSICRTCNDIVPVFENIIEKEGIIKADELAGILHRVCRNNCSYRREQVHSREFCKYIYLSCKTNLRNIVLRDSVFYTRMAYKFYKASINSSIDMILKKQRKPINIQEIYLLLKRLKKKDISFAKVRNVVYSNRDFLAWQRGKYIHADRVSWDLKCLNLIEQHVFLMLREQQVAVSVKNVFKLFSAHCLAEKIPNAYALYSCMKYRGHRHLKYPLFPHITL